MYILNGCNIWNLCTFIAYNNERIDTIEWNIWSYTASLIPLVCDSTSPDHSKTDFQPWKRASKTPLTLIIIESNYSKRRVLTCFSASLASHIAVSSSTGNARQLHTLPENFIYSVKRNVGKTANYPPTVTVIKKLRYLPDNENHNSENLSISSNIQIEDYDSTICEFRGSLLNLTHFYLWYDTS